MSLIDGHHGKRQKNTLIAQLSTWFLPPYYQDARPASCTRCERNAHGCDWPSGNVHRAREHDSFDLRRP